MAGFIYHQSVKHLKKEVKKLTFAVPLIRTICSQVCSKCSLWQSIYYYTVPVKLSCNILFYILILSSCTLSILHNCPMFGLLKYMYCKLLLTEVLVPELFHSMWEKCQPVFQKVCVKNARPFFTIKQILFEKRQLKFILEIKKC